MISCIYSGSNSVFSKYVYSFSGWKRITGPPLVIWAFAMIFEISVVYLSGS